jgi:hypothetical protein
MDVRGTTKLKLPDGVVVRDFGGEMVALNLSAGTYHGLNETAARALGLFEEGNDVAAAAATIAAEYGVSAEQVQRDVEQLCRDLAERGLVEPA